MTFLFVAVLAILGFLCFTGPDGVIGTKHRGHHHRVESVPRDSLQRSTSSAHPREGRLRSEDVRR